MGPPVIFIVFCVYGVCVCVYIFSSFIVMICVSQSVRGSRLGIQSIPKRDIGSCCCCCCCCLLLGCCLAWSVKSFAIRSTNAWDLIKASQICFSRSLSRLKDMRNTGRTKSRPYLLSDSLVYIITTESK